MTACAARFSTAVENNAQWQSSTTVRSHLGAIAPEGMCNSFCSRELSKPFNNPGRDEKLRLCGCLVREAHPNEGPDE